MTNPTLHSVVAYSKPAADDDHGVALVEGRGCAQVRRVTIEDDGQ